MDIPKAIEIVELNIKAGGKRMPPDVKDALELLTACGRYVIQIEAVLDGKLKN